MPAMGRIGTGKDLEIGANGSTGIVELHDNAVMRISDDLKIAEEGAGGNGSVLLDGNAELTVGSGISVTGDGTTGLLSISGNALVVSGNSAAAGDSVNGRTNEGYLTVSSNGADMADVVVRDQGRLYIRSLQQRSGTTNITIENSGQFHVFEVFSFAEPDLGVATLGGSTGGSERSSNIGQGADSSIVVTRA